MCRAISDLGLKIGGPIAQQAKKIAVGLRYPRGPEKAAFQRVLELNGGKALAAPTLRRLLSDWA
jgi:hypothetical protein